MKTFPAATVGLALKPPGGSFPVDGFAWNAHTARRRPALSGVIVVGPLVADRWRDANRYAGQSWLVATRFTAGRAAAARGALTSARSCAAAVGMAAAEQNTAAPHSAKASARRAIPPVTELPVTELRDFALKAFLRRGQGHWDLPPGGRITQLTPSSSQQPQ